MKNLLNVLTAAAVASTLGAQGWSAPTTTETALANSTSTDGAPCLSSDGLTLYFSSNRTVIAPAPLPIGYEVYYTTRTAVGAPWSVATREVACSSSSTDDQPFITSDGLELWFYSSRTGNAGGGDIMRMTRPTVASPWSAAAFVPELQSASIDSSPSMTDDMNEIYFLSAGHGNPAGANNSIFVAQRLNPSLPFGSPQLVAEFYNGNTHRDIQISGNGLEIWFTEYMPAPIGRVRIKHASRLNRALPFGTATDVTEFNAIGNPLGPYGMSVSRDGTEMIVDAATAAPSSTTAGVRKLQSSRFTGCTTTGIASSSSYLELRIRDGAGPVRPYVLVLSGGNTGFFVGPLFVPVDADPIFMMTLGVDVPPFTAGFAGFTDLDGIGMGTIVDPTLGTLAGITLFATGATIDPSTSGISLIGNAVSFQFQP